MSGDSLIFLYLFDEIRNVAELEANIFRSSTDSVVFYENLSFVLGEIGHMLGLCEHFSLIFELGMEMSVAEQEEGAISGGVV